MQKRPSATLSETISDPVRDRLRPCQRLSLTLPETVSDAPRSGGKALFPIKASSFLLINVDSFASFNKYAYICKQS